MRHLEVKVVVESNFKETVVSKLVLDEVRHIFPEALVTAVKPTAKPPFIPNSRRDSW
jgi:hypothetical protein